MPTFDIAIPPSVNHLYVRGLRFSKKGKAYSGLKLSDEAVAFRDALLLQIKQWRAAHPEDDAYLLCPPYRVGVSLILPDKGKRDADNVLKLLVDTLAAGFEIDDNDVHRLEVTKHYGKQEPLCRVDFDSWQEDREWPR